MSAPGKLVPAATRPDEPVTDGAGSSPRRKRRGVVIGAVIAVALVLTALVSFRWGTTDTPQAAPAVTPTPSATPPTTAEIYAAIAPSVVTIEASTASGGMSGTGVIANAQGVILTALHVVNGAGTIRVIFADGTESAATVLGADPSKDIAALAIETFPAVLVPATLGNSGRLAVGDNVIAVGNPLGLTSSATAGVVSGLNRGTTGREGTQLSGLIQFDAAVNPGSSGGPLVNARGEVVAIVVALANPTDAGTFIGIGFAVPIGSAVAAGGGPTPQQ
jgi:S1-C subfamily serine protease